MRFTILRSHQLPFLLETTATQQEVVAYLSNLLALVPDHSLALEGGVGFSDMVPGYGNGQFGKQKGEWARGCSGALL